MKCSGYYICCTSALKRSCYSFSVRSRQRETCCQPPRPSSSLCTVSPTSSLPMAWGNSWLSECSSPLCEHTLIGSAEQHEVPAASFLLVLLKKKILKGERKKIKKKKTRSREIIRRLQRNLPRYVCSPSVSLSCCNENQWGLSHFPHVSLSSGVQ